MLLRLCLVSSFLLISALAHAGSCPLKDGDLIFIKSQSMQSRLLKLTTGSEWTHVGMAFKLSSGWEVIEGIEPVKWTSLLSFVRRSRELSFEVRRATFTFDSKLVKEYAESKLGQNYDLIFSWDDERWYCTEVIWKAYKKASGQELGSLEKIGDLKNIDSAPVRNEAEKRFAQYGIPYDHEEWKKSPVITPVQMLNAENLEEVINQNSSEDFSSCLKK